MKTSERVLELLTRSETYLSGQELADRLQLTRAAIWKADQTTKRSRLSDRQQTTCGLPLHR